MMRSLPITADRTRPASRKEPNTMAALIAKPSTHYIVTSAQLDPARYLTLPNASARALVALSIELVLAAADHDDERCKERVKKLERALKVLQKAEEQRLSQPAQPDKRPTHRRLIAVVACLIARLSAVANGAMPISEVDQAAELLIQVFPEGTEILRLPSRDLWVLVDQRIKILKKSPELRDALERIAGDFLVKELIDAHREHGEILGLVKNGHSVVAPTDAQIDAAAAVDQVRAAIMAYVRALLAVADDGDEATLAMVEQSLAPIDAFRARSRKKKGRPEDEENGETAPSIEPPATPA
jgi:hypothetical protein